MNRSRRLLSLLVVLSVTLLILAGLSAPLVRRTAVGLTPEEVVQRAWRLSQRSGAYHFATSLTQRIYPAPTLANVGQASREERLYLTGQVDTSSQTMEMNLYQETGGKGTIGMRIEGGRIYGRYSEGTGGGEWQELDEIPNAFAPGSDPAAYLVGANNVVALGEETRTLPAELGGALSFTRYGFELDGAAFAAYLHDQLERQLRQQGKLPAGMSLDSTQLYEGMVGSGEVWLDQEGLPLRLIVDIAFPEQPNGERIAATIQTDFSQFNREALRSSTGGILAFMETLGLPVSSKIWHRLGTHIGLVLAVATLMLFIATHRSRRIYATSILVVILSLLGSPLLQARDVAAFFEGQQAQQMEQEQEQKQAERLRNLQEQLTTSTWDPHRDPLASAGAQVAPQSQATLAPLVGAPAALVQSLTVGSSAVLDPNTDTDGDGLSDIQELQLGTDPAISDSDSDQLLDGIEIQGFQVSGKAWYTNPLDPDSDSDGLMDAEECPTLAAPCRDLDGDSTPDIFDRDSDNDGVPDRMDLSPFNVMGSVTEPFNKDNPLEFKLDNLVAGQRPVFVDFQLRPTDPKRLWYAFNVLDWPSGDAAGQIQRLRSTTFADSLSSAQREADPRSQNGDLRLLPMLEIEMSGLSTPGPLPLTNPQLRLELSGSPAGTINFTQAGGDVTAHFEYSSPDSYTVSFFEGSCTDRESMTPMWFTRNTEIITQWTVQSGTEINIPGSYLTRLANGNTSMVMKHSQDTNKDRCLTLRDIPNGPYISQMIDTTSLSIYGVSIRDKSETDKSLVAYVPLQLASDETGDGRVAFQARMPYLSTINWGNASRVRVVWLLYMLTDPCHAVSPGQDPVTWCQDLNNRQEVGAIIHTYDDSWYLTGLAVHEDHGLDVAIAFEDPATDNDLNDDSRLWTLAYGLEHAWISGRDQDNNGWRDLSIGEIKRRFDRDVNGGVSNIERWNIPQNALQVETFFYPHEDYVVQIMMTETVRLLNTHFTSNGQPIASAPSLLFIEEKRARTANLDLAGSIAQISGRSVTMNLDPLQRPTEVWVSVNWAPYQYNAQQAKWISYPIEEYWDLLGLRFKAWFPVDPTLADGEAIAQGEINLARGYYLALFNGFTSLVQIDQTLIKDKVHFKIDDELATLFGSLVKGPGKLIVDSIVQFIMADPDLTKAVNGGSSLTIKALLSGHAKEVWSKYSSFFSPGTFKRLAGKVVWGSGVLGAIAVVGLTIWAATHQESDAKGVSAALTGLSTLLALNGSLMLSKKVLEDGLVKATTIAETKQFASKAIGFIISVTFTWGAMALQVHMAGADWGSLQANAAMGSAIASTFVAYVLFAIGLIPVIGPIIVTAVALLDTLTALICLAIESTNEWCKGLSGQFAQFLMDFGIYSAEVMVDLENPDRLQVKNFNLRLADPTLGMVVGNRFILDMDVKTNLRAKDGKWASNSLKPMTVRYRLQPNPPEQFSDQLELNQMKHEWISDLDGKGIYTRQRATTTILLQQPGLNQPIDLFLSEGMVLLVNECKMFEGCERHQIKAQNDLPLQSLFFDILPNTLDGFMELQSKDGGYSLAWAQKGNTSIPDWLHVQPTFGRQKDADGDGLLNTADGGSDPNDSTWDTDGDGLSDLFERRWGTDPTKTHSDLDELSDYEEFLIGTNPNQRDSDADGLNDSEELKGWQFVYAAVDGSQRTTWVTSDPLTGDGDADGLLDAREKVYGSHPRVPSESKLFTYETELWEENAPRALLRFEENAGALAFRDDSGFGHTAACSAQTCPRMGLTGRMGKAIAFDGINDFISIPAPLTLGGTGFAVSAWIYAENPFAFWSRIIDFGNGQASDNIMLAFEGTSGKMTFHILKGWEGRSITTAEVFPQNRWVHVVASVDRSGNAFIAWDGTVKASGIIFPYEPLPRANQYLGRSNWAEDAYFKGRLDEVLIFDRPLTRDEQVVLMEGRYNPNDLVVKPGDRLAYLAAVKNQLLNRYAHGIISVLLAKHDPLTTDLKPATFQLQPQQEERISGSLEVKNGAYSTPFTVTLAAQGAIVDWREQSNYADIWLKLDEEAGASSFADSSGNVPPHDATCTMSSCPTAEQPGILDSALAFDGLDDVLAIPRTINSDFSIAFWMQSTQTAGNGVYWWEGQGLFVQDSTLLRSGYFGISLSGSKVLFGIRQEQLSTTISSGNEPVADGHWHHIVATRRASDGRLDLYVDGKHVGYKFGLKGELNQGSQIRIGSLQNNVNFFQGLLDDIRIFPYVISPGEIADLFTFPQLYTTFDEQETSLSGSHSFTDSSYSRNTFSCVDTSCPGRVPGINGQAADFAGSHNLSVTAKRWQTLDLSNGNFTMSAWVYPTSTDSTVRGILGRGNGLPDAYPSLLAIGSTLRFGFGNGQSWIAHDTSNALTPFQWNHIVATLQPAPGTTGGYHYTLYVNGQIRDQNQTAFTSAPTISTMGFDIGRASNRGSVYLGLLSTKDPSYFYQDRISLKVGQQVIWGPHSIDDAVNLKSYNIAINYPFSEQVSITCWHQMLDGGGIIAEAPCGEYTVNTNTPSTSGFVWNVSNYSGFSGEIYGSYTNDGLPFHGHIDEIAIYKQALQPGDVEALYRSGRNPIALRFDDVPGSTSFKNASGLLTGRCVQPDCPTTGVRGRINQAALFDGNNDAVEISNPVVDDFSIAFWMQSDQFREYSTYNKYWWQGMGLVDGEVPGVTTDFGVSLGEAGAVLFGVGDPVLGDVTIAGGNVADTRWHHVVATRSRASGELRLYIDGVQVASGTGSTASLTAPSNLRIGSLQTGVNFYRGLIDDVNMYTYVLTPSEVQALFQSAPIFDMAFDEDDPRTNNFFDAAGNIRSGK